MPSEHPEPAPAPWTNTGESYLFFLSTPASLPEGAYAPLEGKSFYGSPEAGAFSGKVGAATVQVVRYNNTPAGPYDELIYIPGFFGNPSGNPTVRVTRIYVSTDESTYNGRKNWNIPKYVARFSFTRLQPDSANSPVKIEVFPPSPADTPPFFSAVATPSKWLPNFPINTKYVPMNMRMVHPPLPSLEPNAYSVIGTDQWVSILANIKGKAEIVWYKPSGDENKGIEAGEYADGVGFPKFQPWSCGIHLKTLTLEFPEGQVVEDKKTK